MNKVIWIFLLGLFFSSCSGVSKNQLKKELTRKEEVFSYVDKNGQYEVLLSSGFNKKENSFFTKRILGTSGRYQDNDNKNDQKNDQKNEKILEQSIVFSDLGSIKKKNVILRPRNSQYNVWFEGKKYSSELKINSLKKTIDIKMTSPEKQWSGTKQVKLPNTKALYCFFSQVIECAKVIGFLKESIKKDTGIMNFYVVWEGYPYLNEMFSDFPAELISRAQLEFDGNLKEGEKRFNLKVGGQSIFLVVNKYEQLKKMFWVSQGVSMVSKTEGKL